MVSPSRTSENRRSNLKRELLTKDDNMDISTNWERPEVEPQTTPSSFVATQHCERAAKRQERSGIECFDTGDGGNKMVKESCGGTGLSTLLDKERSSESF